MKEKSRSTFRNEHWVRSCGSRQCGGTWKYMEVSVSGSKGRRRTFSAGVSDTCSDLWLCIAYH